MSKRACSGLLVVGGGALMAVSAYLAWIEVRAPFSAFDRAAYNGIETGDGHWAILLGVAAGLMGVMAIVLTGLPSFLPGTGSMLGGAIGGWVAWTNFDDVPRFKAEVAFRSAGDAYGVIGPGLWALAAGATVTAIGGLLLWVSGPGSQRRPSVADIGEAFGLPLPPPAHHPAKDAIVSEESAEPTILCVNGHAMDPAHRYCPSCGGERWV